MSLKQEEKSLLGTVFNGGLIHIWWSVMDLMLHYDHEVHLCVFSSCFYGLEITWAISCLSFSHICNNVNRICYKWHLEVASFVQFLQNPKVLHLLWRRKAANPFIWETEGTPTAWTALLEKMFKWLIDSQNSWQIIFFKSTMHNTCCNDTLATHFWIWNTS